jgi:hypothetical protein
MQVAYDYQSAKFAQDPVDSTFEQMLEWGQSEEAYMLIAGGGNAWSTRRVGTQGVFVSTRGAGSITLFTADDGTTFTPPQSYSFTVTNVRPDSEVGLYNDDGTLIENDQSVTGSVQDSPLAAEDGGTGYTVNDKLTLVGGIFTIAGILNVDAVDGGVVTSVSVDTSGSYTEAPSSPVSVTGGTGSGATFQVDIRGTFSHTYTYAGSDIDAYLVVFHLNYKPFRAENVILSNASQSFAVFQVFDRVFENP